MCDWRAIATIWLLKRRFLCAGNQMQLPHSQKTTLSNASLHPPCMTWPASRLRSTTNPYLLSPSLIHLGQVPSWFFFGLLFCFFTLSRLLFRQVDKNAVAISWTSFFHLAPLQNIVSLSSRDIKPYPRLSPKSTERKVINSSAACIHFTLDCHRRSACLNAINHPPTYQNKPSFARLIVPSLPRTFKGLSTRLSTLPWIKPPNSCLNGIKNRFQALENGVISTFLTSLLYTKLILQACQSSREPLWRHCSTGGAQIQPDPRGFEKSASIRSR